MNKIKSFISTSAFLLGCVLSLIITGCTSQKQSLDSSVYETIITRIQKDNQKVDIKAAEKDIDEYLSAIREDGSFPDIDYTSRSQTNWKPLTHLNRLTTMAIGYTADSKYKDNADLYKDINNALEFWHNSNPTSTNWFYQQIACPQRMGVILILLRSGDNKVPAELEAKLVKRMKDAGGAPDQRGSQGTGANKLAIATHWIYRGCLTEDENVLSFGVEQAYHPVQFTTGQGIQYDYSYQQHGKQLHIGGYGTGVADEISKLATYMVGTPFALSQDKLKIFSGFIRNAYIPVIRGRYYLYNVLGRGLSRENELDQISFIPILERMKQLEPEYASIYQESIDRLSQRVKPGHGIEPKNTHFWCSDYTLHQRPRYTFDVRLASVFTARSENGNGENLKGYFLTEGATTLVREGDEYLNIFPVWDWAKIPGTTVPAVKEIPLPGQWEKKGSSTFAGGVSDGNYGVSAYSMNESAYDINTRANKSWFQFDREIVCLGAGISSENDNEICTTVNQALLQSDITVNAGNQVSTLKTGNHSFTTPSWIYHHGVGYYFPEGGNISVSNQTQTGSWYSINNSRSDETVSDQVFKLWINHGVKPENASYAYIIAPEVNDVNSAKTYNTNSIQILTNTKSVQAVKHNTLQTMGIVFYEPGTFTTPEFTIETDKNCVIMLTGLNKKQISLYIADPARSNNEINIKAFIHPLNRELRYTVKLPVHPDPYAGSTKSFKIDLSDFSVTPQN